jgi:RHS repeat-associated protein
MPLNPPLNLEWRISKNLLYNYDARLYDPVIGRFISPDSIIPDYYDPQTLNRYGYCRNNPLIYVDPSGYDFYAYAAQMADHGAGAWAAFYSAYGESSSGTTEPNLKGNPDSVNQPSLDAEMYIDSWIRAYLNRNKNNVQKKSKYIIQVCKKQWDKHKNNCSGFVKAVAENLGIHLKGNANQIVDQIQKEPWKSTKKGRTAKEKADQGKFVVGGTKGKSHGHVVAIVSGPLDRSGQYPKGYWGYLNVDNARENTSINYSWDRSQRDNVTYGYIDIP